METPQVPRSGHMNKKIVWGRVIIAFILFTVIAMIVHTVGAMLTMGYYQMEEYFCVWSKVMMPAEGPPPIEFTIISIVFNLILAFFITVFYAKIKDVLPGRGAGKGLFYGLFLFLIVGLAGFFMTYMFINLPMMLNIAWLIEGLIIYLIGGWIISKLVK